MKTVSEDKRFYIGLRIKAGTEREVVVLHGDPDVVRTEIDRQQDETYPVYLMEAIDVREPRPHPDRT